MPSQRIDSSPDTSATCADEPVAEAAIMGLLLSSKDHGLWSREELVRTLSAPRLDVVDALTGLVASELVHELGEFILASRAARAFDRLDL
jgi:hypothetical protein